MTTTPSTALATRKLSSGELLKREFDKWKPTLAAVLPRHLDAERIIKMAIGAFMRSDDLQACTIGSIIKATIMAAELGLEPGGLLGECYLVGYSNKKKVRDGNVWKEVKVREATLIPGYRGLIKLARQTGDVVGIYAVAVDESEVRGFRVVLGTERRIEHEMDLTAARTEKLFAAYGVVQFRDGSNHFEVMTKGQIDAIKNRSAASSSGPWVSDYAAMAKKTMIKQVLKMVTLSPEKPALAQAIAADNAAESGEAFNTDLTAEFEVIEEGGEDTSSPDVQAQPVTRSAELASKLGVVRGTATPAHDPATGEIKQP